MKIKHFYTHLIQVNDITLDLGDVEMSKEERLHLLSLLDANIHATVMHTVLSELPTGEKKIFLTNLVENNHDKILKHLRMHINDLDIKITNAADKLISEMRNDIKLVNSLK